MHSDTQKSDDDFQDVRTNVDIVASRLRSHFDGLSRNFENMAPEAVMEIAHHLIEYRDRKARSWSTEPSGTADL